MNAIDVYDEIRRLSLEQREAIKSGDLERLLALLARRGMLMSSLSEEPNGRWDEAQRQQIAELDGIHEAAVRAWRDRVASELDELQRSRTGLGGYRAQAPVDTVFVDRIC